jgi:hypothetical protein
VLKFRTHAEGGIPPWKVVCINRAERLHCFGTKPLHPYRLQDADTPVADNALRGVVVSVPGRSVRILEHAARHGFSGVNLTHLKEVMGILA